MFFTHDRSFEEFFCICIQLLNKTWKEMRATSEDFNKVRVRQPGWGVQVSVQSWRQVTELRMGSIKIHYLLSPTGSEQQHSCC